MLKDFISRISSKHDFYCFCHICHYFLDIIIPFNFLIILLNAEEANTKGAAEEQAIIIL